MVKMIMMANRELKRVPLNFDWELNKVWHGYLMSTCLDDSCDDCKEFARLKKLKIESHGCPFFDFLEPPKGNGFQCWETTSEGSPISPIFKTLDALCGWLAKNSGDTVLRGYTKKDWEDLLKEKSIAMDMDTNKPAEV